MFLCLIYAKINVSFGGCLIIEDLRYPKDRDMILSFKTQHTCTESNLNKKLMIHVAFNCIFNRWWLPNRLCLIFR